MDLTGQVIIAMPDMGDPRFERAVILICAHSSSGAMGLIPMLVKAKAHLRAASAPKISPSDGVPMSQSLRAISASSWPAPQPE